LPAESWARKYKARGKGFSNGVLWIVISLGVGGRVFTGVREAGLVVVGWMGTVGDTLLESSGRNEEVGLDWEQELSMNQMIETLTAKRVIACREVIHLIGT